MVLAGYITTDWQRCRAVNLLSSTLVFLQIILAGLGLVFVRGKQLGQAEAVNYQQKAQLGGGQCSGDS